MAYQQIIGGGRMRLNTIYNEDCLEGMKRIPDGSVDLTVTSPPYDNLRSYNGNNEAWNQAFWKSVIEELYRVTKDGGVVVWIVGDATVKGSETGTSFKQALYFKEVGFNIHDTMIYRKTKYVPLTHNRYEQAFEYMFVMSKGKPKTFNGVKEKTKHAGENTVRTFYQDANQNLPTAGNTPTKVKETKLKSNVWDITPGVGAIKGHPAQFPLSLAEDHLISWSKEDDVILDPFMGSGTTAIACLNTNRQYIGFELDETYHKLSLERIENHEQQLSLI